MFALLIGFLVLGWNLVFATDAADFDDPCISMVWRWDAEAQSWETWYAPPWMLAESGENAGELVRPGPYWVYCE